jgi:transcriptional regulator with XRE-family HTH domain
MDSRTIGRRVKYWRTRRNLTRAQLADRCDRSVSWVDKIETGERNLLRLPMLERVAAALDIEVSVLTDDEAARLGSQCLDAAEVRAIKGALGSYESIVGGGGPLVAGPPDLARLRRNVDHACSAWLSSHFAVMGRVLPGLIREAQHAVQVLDGDERLEATRHLVMAYCKASSTLLKFDAVDVAWLAADRAVNLASGTGDTACLARATRSVARAMTSAGQRREAIDVLVAMAGRMEAELPGDPGTVMVSTYGMLLLPAEIAAARDGDADTALALHRQAEAVAGRLGPAFNDRVTAFGAANVALHRVSALVRLHEGTQALAFARTIHPDAVARLPRERRANHLLDLAEGHRQAGQAREAARALVRAEQVAPEEVRCRPLVRQLLSRLLEHPVGGASGELRQLARRVGLAA